MFFLEFVQLIKFKENHNEKILEKFLHLKKYFDKFSLNKNSYESKPSPIDSKKWQAQIKLKILAY